MCGIVGYVGRRPAVRTLLDALGRLEYRGYDSAGIAVLSNGRVAVAKRVGKLHGLRHALTRGGPVGTVGLGHTRWATHGEPSTANAHPHTDCDGTVAIVHNGIIENFSKLKERLLAEGHTFRSHTDTEVVAHLIETYHEKAPLLEAVRRAASDLQGSYALGVVSAREPGTVIGVRNGCPLVVGVGRGESFLASDVAALLGYTKDVLYLNDQELIVLSAGAPRLLGRDGRRLRRACSRITWDLRSAQKEGFPHFMLKEIHEQPAAIAQTLVERVMSRGRGVSFDHRTRVFLDRAVVEADALVIISCGTAYHAGLVGEYMLEEYAKIPVDVDLASEFRYRSPMLDRRTVVLAISQSGETADTLAGVRLARERGAKVLAICNVMGSTIARESDAVIYTHAGPEIAVASTKAYTAQLAALCLLAIFLGQRRAHRGRATGNWQLLLKELGELPQLVARVVEDEALHRAVRRCAAEYADRRNFLYLGRRYNYPSALEGALKLKEICPKIHAEGYAAGEMKHGPISLIRDGWPVVCLATDSAVLEKMSSNIQEIRARGGHVISIASAGNREIPGLSTRCVTVPVTQEIFSPILVAVPLQLLAYHLARENRFDIDQPKNLAKSVTVE